MKLLCLVLVAISIFYVSGQRINTVEIGSNKYFFSDTTPYSPRLNWALSYQYCRSIGMDLISFTTMEEAQTFQAYLQDNGRQAQAYWTSGNRLGSAMWLWMTTGHAFNTTFNLWYRRGDHLRKKPNRCMKLQTGSWVATRCDETNAFACQLTRCFYFNYAVSNNSNSAPKSQGKRNIVGKMSSDSSKFPRNTDQQTNPLDVIHKSTNQNASTPHQRTIEPPRESQDKFSPHLAIPDIDNQNEIIQNTPPVLSTDLLPPRSESLVKDHHDDLQASATSLEDFNQFRRLQRKEQFSWAFGRKA